MITSQNDTAPKLFGLFLVPCESLITSQNDTAPKLCWQYMSMVACLITSQNDTAPKLLPLVVRHAREFDYQSE